MLDEITISKAIIEEFYRELLDSLDSDVVIAGAGPSGLCAAYYIAKEGYKTLVFEKNLRLGGGMPGGGMLFNRIVVQRESKQIMDELEIPLKLYADDYYVAHSLEALGILTVKAVQAGTRVFNGITVEDVIIKDGKVEGVVINWSAVDIASLHVDPLCARCRMVIDATGHPAEVARGIQRKSGERLLTGSGGVIGEKPMWAEAGEKAVLENTREVYPNLYVSGMAANAAFGGPRMGPVFGGMFLSGKKVADLVLERLK